MASVTTLETFVDSSPLEHDSVSVILPGFTSFVERHCDPLFSRHQTFLLVE